MKYSKTLEYKWGADIYEGGVSIFHYVEEDPTIQPTEEKMEYWTYEFLNPILDSGTYTDKIWKSRRIESFKEARVEGMEQLDDLVYALENLKNTDLRNEIGRIYKRLRQA